MSNTLTRSDLAQAVHLEVGLSRNESSQLVEDVLEKITDWEIDERMLIPNIFFYSE